MTRKRNNSRGVNVIAAVLMIISFFLVIGFSIAAMSMMNLNLTGRSVNLVKSRHLAQAAVDQVIYHINEVTTGGTGTIPLNNLSCPSLNLDDRYDGVRGIFDGAPSYMEDNCHVDIHFKKKDVGDSYYSTDNLNNRAIANGARGAVPPYTLDLIISVRVGNFEKVYEVWLRRCWNYALYGEKSPIYLLSNNNKFKKIETYIKGNVYSAFYPKAPLPPGQAHLPYKVLEGNIDEYGIASFDSTALANFIPGKDYPASVFVGGQVNTVAEKKSWDERVVSYNAIGNTLEGRTSFKMQPTDCGIYVYPDNNEDKVEGSDFNSPIPPLFEKLKPVTMADHEINKTTYPSEIDEVTSSLYALNKTPGPQIFKVTIHKPPQPGDLEAYDAFMKDYQAYVDLYDNRSSWRNVFFLKSSLTIKPSEQDPMQWDEQHTYEFKTQDGQYFPVVDRIGTLAIDPTPAPSRSSSPAEDIYSFTVTNGTTEGGGTLEIQDALLISNRNIEIHKTHLKGDNCMIQVLGDLRIYDGNITAGTDVGTAVYCESLLCAIGGTFNGIVFAKNTVRIQSPEAADAAHLKNPLIVRGAIINKGGDCDYTQPYGGGIVATGFSVTCDPRFTACLNVFAPLTIVSWRDID